MTKIAFIGAGSVEFTKNLLGDILDLVHRGEPQVGARQHADNARHHPCLICRDAYNARVRHI